MSVKLIFFAWWIPLIYLNHLRSTDIFKKPLSFKHKLLSYKRLQIYWYTLATNIHPFIYNTLLKLLAFYSHSWQYKEWRRQIFTLQENSGTHTPFWIHHSWIFILKIGLKFWASGVYFKAKFANLPGNHTPWVPTRGLP